MKEKPLTIEDFLETVSKHEINIIHNDGFYRHVRFKKPDCSSYFFDLITGHGYLMIRGDMGCYVFERVPDMFQFFRNAKATTEAELTINDGYWAEKCVSQSIFGNGIKKFSMDLFREAVENDLNDFIEANLACGSTLDEAELRQAVEDDIKCCSEDESSAIEAIRNFTYEDEEVFTDFFEHNFESYTYHYLWCCYAITWGIFKFDREVIRIQAALNGT